MHVLVTGGCGFIGSEFIRLLLRERPQCTVLNFDKLTYAGNRANLRTVEDDSRYSFRRGDICDERAVAGAFETGPNAVVNFAAETHVDRSIAEPAAFLHTAIVGTHTLLEAARRTGARYLQVSTDEVYGDKATGCSTEDDPLYPSSPYAASKAGADLLTLSFGRTYDVPVLVTRGSNTYGHFQYPEKLVPLFITQLLDGLQIPVYGDGGQVRDWLHVRDHAHGILHVLECGAFGHIYNLGSGEARDNLALTRELLALCGKPFEKHVRFVTDRPGHDRRYSVDSSKAHALGWRHRVGLVEGMRETVGWYRANESWWRAIKSGAFKEYARRQYGGAVSV